METPYYLFSEKYETWIRSMQQRHGVSFAVNNQTGEVRVRRDNRTLMRFCVAQAFKQPGYLREIEHRLNQ